jgi:type IV pilus assembly protein PilB
VAKHSVGLFPECSGLRPRIEFVAPARKVGCRSLRHDGLKKVLLGLTTIEEIEAQTPVEIG